MRLLQHSVYKYQHFLGYFSVTLHIILLSFRTSRAEEVDWSAPNAYVYQQCVQYIRLFPSNQPSSTSTTSTFSTSTTIATTAQTSSSTSGPKIESEQASMAESNVTKPAITDNSMSNNSTDEPLLNQTLTTSVTPGVTETTQVTDYCGNFDIIYDQALTVECMILKEYRRNSDFTEALCKERCLQHPACRAVEYSSERDPNCRLFAYKSGDLIGKCQTGRAFDWKLFQIKQRCKDQKCSRFQHVQGTLLSGCRNEDSGFRNPTNAQCELTCAENHWCLAYVFKLSRDRGGSRTSCQLYIETPETSGLCLAVNDRSVRRKSKLMVKVCRHDEQVE